jgi:REP element-mobilizing transposase RayT
MSQSLSKIYIHLVFSTKNRLPLITDEIEKELFAYAATVLGNMDCHALRVGGMADHVHILCVQSKKITLVDLVSKIKTTTSKWIKTKSAEWSEFSWQVGYGAFSVSQSDMDAVSDYIRDQKAHHEKMTFQDELRTLLTRYNVDFDEKYLWD